MTDKELVQEEMRMAVRWAASSNYWSEKLREFLGPDARDGIVALEQQLRDAREELARLQQPEKTNQCAETCERAKLCAVCGVSLNQEQGAVAWMYTNAQGKTVIVEGDVQPYDDAIPLFKLEPQPEQKEKNTCQKNK